MAQTSKLELLMTLSDKLFNSKLDQVQAKLSGVTAKMDAKLNRFTGSQVNMAAKVAGAFAAIGGAALLTVGLDKSIDAAVKFDSAFLPIKQLNLDKSKAEMDSYRNIIRDSSYEVGTDLATSTKAYYDLQSATGLYGKEAESVFKMVGKYSIATGANLGDAMNSTTKSMKAYGLGVADIDALLTSNAKTVQVGITTFDELARVQTDYAGAVSSAGQNFDTGNKVFAMFTSIAKSADTAANMTKTFFDGIGSQSKEIQDNLGIKVFDAKGNMKDADKILFEISSKFKNMNEQQITGIINKIGGPEGLRSGLAKVKTGADDMIATFNGFDASKFSIAEALKNADADFATMKTKFNNRIEIIFSKIGEKMIPALSKMLDVLTPTIDWLAHNLDWLIPVIVNVTSVLAAFTAGVWLFNIATAANPIGLITIAIGAMIAMVTIAIMKFDTWGAAFLVLMGPVGLLIIAFKSLYDHWDSIKKAFKDDGIIGGLKRIGQVLLDVILKPMQQFFEMIGMDSIAGKIEELRSGLDTVTGAENDNRQALTADVLNPNNFIAGTAWNTKAGLIKAPTTPDGKPKGDGLKKQSDNVNKVAGSANQIRKIDIHIDSFNKGGINVAQSAYGGMTKEDVEAWFKEMLRRTIINAETA